MKRAVWWIKRDFRLNDNQALVQALLHNDEVLPLFVFEPELINQPDYSPMHVWAWQQALIDLQKNLRARQADVLVATGEVVEVLTGLQKKWNFCNLYSHEETGNNWTFVRDKAVANWCKQQCVNWQELPQTGVVRRLKSRDERQPIAGRF